MADGQDSGFVYIDDILVASKDKEEHEWRLRLVLDCLRECSMVLNGKKCVMGVSKMDYLGHHISASGILPMPQCVAAIKEHPQPTTARGLQTYLGLVNFYRCFLPAVADVLRPLTEALKGAPKGQIKWLADMERSFVWSKSAMLNVVELANPSPGADLSLTTDSSDTHVGAVLVVKHFSWMLEGRSFCIYTVGTVWNLNTQRLVAGRLVWCGCAADVARWCQECQ